ncbi:ATP-binding protein [Subtercola endophyticus]|uniref:ATP-binding protein n=1 Tax=Subtercola endophyticus TaxID=2895559 RepID=UPI001E45154C|nr:ATP-binding protein [Subtercola endophyticus]UFS59061.1 ATP-binding protein [Subtercola endophyticus]
MNRNEPQELVLESATGAPRPLVLKFGGSLVEQLGAQLYPSVTATVAELISNAWDADANHVWVTVPFGDDWSENGELVVLDDGHGMTRSEAQEAYLVVGRKKRLTRLGDKSEGGRLVHGRKGIGKLAAFGTAGYLECTTVRDGVRTSFGIDYDELRLLNPDQNYFVDDIVNPLPLLDPNGVPLEHGTRVRLTKLRVKRKISADTFQTAMSRRFAIRDMKVIINGRPLERFDIPLQFRLPRDETPAGAQVDSDGWGVERLPSGDEIKWWIGFTEKPLTDSDQLGVSVLARDKMAQRPFKFERSAGTTAQLGMEYLVGEVVADWLDQGDDIDSDYIQSNRDQLQLENARLDEFMDWGRRRLAWALRVRQDLRQKLSADETEKNEELDLILGNTSSRERRALRGVADKLGRLPEIEQSQVNEIMRSVIESRSDAQVQRVAAEIETAGDDHDPELWSLVSQFGAIDARRLIAVIEARLTTIEKIRAGLARGGHIVGAHEMLGDDIWVVDPRLHQLGSGIEMNSVLAEHDWPISPKDSSIRVFAPMAPAATDEIAIIELRDEVETNTAAIANFTSLVERVQQFQISQGAPALVHGMLISSSYDSVPPDYRAAININSLGSVKIRTWAEVLEQSRDLHLGWLAISRSRAAKVQE